MILIYNDFEIKSTFIGNKSNYVDAQNFNNHMIKITNINTKMKITFEYWNSTSELNGEINNEQQLLEAFLLLLNEAQIGIRAFDDYLLNIETKETNLTDEMKRKYNSYYKRCVKNNGKLLKIFDGDLLGLIKDTEEHINILKNETIMRILG